MIKKLLSVLFIPALLGCNLNLVKKKSVDPAEMGRQREQASAERNNDNLGKYIDTIDFNVYTPNSEDGVTCRVSIANPEKDLPQMQNPEEIVISQHAVTIIIDYPLTNEYKFDLSSDTGFTRIHLLNEISKAYRKIYEEEEASATIKTIPREKRKTLYNRNETNGKYGIWGHDIEDLILTQIEIYEAPDKKLILALITES
nr:hypothetical protein [Pedobacter panaciterrae]